LRRVGVLVAVAMGVLLLFGCTHHTAPSAGACHPDEGDDSGRSQPRSFAATTSVGLRA
jgi:hypothetical protein